MLSDFFIPDLRGGGPEPCVEHGIGWNGVHSFQAVALHAQGVGLEAIERCRAQRTSNNGGGRG